MSASFTLNPAEARASAPASLPAGLSRRSHTAASAHRRRYIASAWALSRSRRTLDVVVAALVLTVFALPMAAIAIAVRLTSRGPALFNQRRVGRAGMLFTIYKFRSMYTAPARSPGIGLTYAGDHRITPLGRWLRTLKLDELPQFYNVLRGDMSLVGPRPKLPRYAVLHDMPYRPGITGAASLIFRNEEALLGNVPAEQISCFYDRHIRPLKARIDTSYMAHASFWSDLRVLGATTLSFAIRPRVPVTLRRTIQLSSCRA